MPSISEAVERAAVANGGKNLIDRGPRCYERSPGELLPQTFPSEPSTAVEQQQANPLPDLPPKVPRAPTPSYANYGRFCTVAPPSVSALGCTGHFKFTV